jgi:hypothetical protein
LNPAAACSYSRFLNTILSSNASTLLSTAFRLLTFHFLSHRKPLFKNLWVLLK